MFEIYEMLKSSYISYIVIGITILFVLYYFGFFDRIPHYTRKTHFFSENERLFYRELRKQLHTEYEIFGQVRVADILDTNKKLDKQTGLRAFYKISSKHFDYVLCDKITLKIIAAIELDDSSHNRKDRIERDNFLNAACEDASMPLLRIKAKNNYKNLPIQKTFNTILEKIALELKSDIKPIFIHSIVLV